MTVFPYGMSVDCPVNSLPLHLGKGISQDLVSRQSDLHILQQDVLEPVAAGKDFLQVGGGILFAFAKDIPHMLCIGIQAHSRDTEITMENITPLNDRIGFIGHIHPFSLDAHAWLKPRTVAEVLSLLP